MTNHISAQVRTHARAQPVTLYSCSTAMQPAQMHAGCVHTHMCITRWHDGRLRRDRKHTVNSWRAGAESCPYRFPRGKGVVLRQLNVVKVQAVVGPEEAE
jgi:hypothetical protein